MHIIMPLSLCMCKWRPIINARVLSSASGVGNQLLGCRDANEQSNRTGIRTHNQREKIKREDDQ